MAKCPFCGKEINSVIVRWRYEVCWVIYDVKDVGRDSDCPEASPLEWEEKGWDVLPGGELERASCPFCDATLPLKSEDEIEKFLEA